MSRMVVVLCALAVTLGGCARGDEVTKPTRTIEPRLTASSPSPKATATDVDACALLTSRERRSITGVKVDHVAPLAAAQDSRQCRWINTPASPLPALQVTTTPARTWVLLLPQTIDGTIAS